MLNMKQEITKQQTQTPAGTLSLDTIWHQESPPLFFWILKQFLHGLRQWWTVQKVVMYL